MSIREQQAFGLIMGKATLLRFYDAAGLGSVGLPLPTLRAVIGGFEMLLGVLCLVATWPVFFLFGVAQFIAVCRSVKTS